MICWICKEDEGNTREHIFKKDLVKGGSYHVPLDYGNVKLIQGPKSKIIKYNPSICAKCNNKRSREWDNAYSLFANYCFNYPEADEIDFTKIYGSSYSDSIRNLHCYFVKSLGCRIIDAGFYLPDNFPNLLLSPNLLTLKISIHKNPCPLVLYILKEDTSISKINRETLLKNNRALGKSNILAVLSKRNYKVQNAIWWENIGNYQFNYWLNREADLRFGVPMEYSMPIYKMTRHSLDLIEIEDYMERIFYGVV